MKERHALLVAMGDDRSREFLCDQLGADGYAADGAHSAREALTKAGSTPPDALLLGELDSRGEAIELLRQVRSGDALRSSFDPTVPVIVLSEDGGELALLRAFEAGCDDFVAAPFSYPEIRARLRPLIRRSTSRVCGAKRVGALRIDPHARVATCAGERLPLSRLEFALLDRLASEPKRVFTKEELLREVWGFRSMGNTRTLDAHACRLRKKLRDTGGPGFVVCVRGVGYRLTELSLVSENGGSPPMEDAPHAA